MADTFDQYRTSTTSGVRIVEPGEYSAYTRQFLESGTKLRSTLYEIPYSGAMDYYRRRGSSAILNANEADAEERRRIDRFTREAGGRVTEFIGAELHFKSHVADIEGRREAYIPTGNLGQSALELSEPPSTAGRRRRELRERGYNYEGSHFQVNIGLEITNPEIVKEVERLQNTLGEGRYIERTRHFASGDVASRELSSQLSGAGKGDRITVVSPYMDNMRLVRQIARASKEGAEVTIISAEGPGGGNPTTVAAARNLLASAGAKVYTADETLLVHAKYASILRGDNTGYAQLGSSNYTYASARGSTLDYMFVANDPTMAAQLLDVSQGMVEDYGLRRISKSFEVTKYDLGPLGSLLRPAYTKRDLLTAAYSKQYGQPQEIIGALPYYPTIMPQEYFQMYQGRALPQVSIYQNLYEAYTNKEAPTALKVMDAQMSDMGMGNMLNRMLGINLYQPGSGIGMTALRGLGRMLDTVFGHYQYQDYKAEQRGDTRGSISKLQELYYSNEPAGAGFFEQAIMFSAESISAVGLSLASYFAVTHAWNSILDKFTDTGVDFLLDVGMEHNKVANFALREYLGPIAYHFTTESRRLASTAEMAGAGGELLRRLAYGPTQLPDARFGRSMELFALTMRDYSVLDPLGEMTEINDNVLSRVKALDLFSFSQLRLILDDPEVSDVLLSAGVRSEKDLLSFYLDSILGKDKTLANELARTFAPNKEVYDGLFNFLGFDYDDYAKGSPAFLSVANPNLKNQMLLIQEAKMEQYGLDVANHRIKIVPGEKSGGLFGGLFGMMAASRRAEQAMFNAITVPILEHVSVVGEAEKSLFKKDIKHLADIIGAPPTIRYAAAASEGLTYIKPTVLQYGFHRMETLAKAYEEVAYFVPTNMLLWFKPIRDLLGIESLAVAGDELGFELDSRSAGNDTAQRSNLRLRLQGQSLKGLIGSGFRGLVDTQRAIAYNLKKLATNPGSTFSDAFNLMSNEFELRVIEDDLLKGARKALDTANRQSTVSAQNFDEAFNAKRMSAADALRGLTEELYGEISPRLENQIIASLQQRYKSMSLVQRRFYEVSRRVVSPITYTRNRFFSQARQASNEVFQMPAFADDMTYHQRYTGLIAEQEKLNQTVLSDTAYADLTTAKSAPYSMFRRFMMGAGLFFAADYLIDRFFMRAPGADLLTQIWADANLGETDSESGEFERFARMRFEGHMHPAVKYTVGLAGFVAGGLVFGESRLSDTVVGHAINAMKPASAKRGQFSRLLSATAREVVESKDVELLARLGDVPQRRISRRFGMTGAVVGMAAALFATQTVYSTVAHVANVIGNRYNDGLHIGGLYAQFSSTLMNAVSEAIQVRSDSLSAGGEYRTTRMAQADIMLGTMIAGEYQRTAAGVPGRGLYSYAYQLTTPMFQLALVQRHEAATGITTYGAGFQFLPILGMGTTPLLPFSIKLSDGRSRDRARANIVSADGDLSPEARALLAAQQQSQQGGVASAMLDTLNLVATGGLGPSLAYNSQSSFSQAMMFIGAAGIATDSARYIAPRLPNFLRREIKEMGVFADMPYHGLRLMNQLVEFSQMPLMLVPDTLYKGYRATEGAMATSIAGADPVKFRGKLAGFGARVGAAMALFPLGAGLSQMLEDKYGIEGSGLQPGTFLHSVLFTSVAVAPSLAAGYFAGRAVSGISAEGNTLTKITKKLPSFSRRAVPYYISYLVAQSVTDSDTGTVELDEDAVRLYSNLALAAMYGTALDNAGVFASFEDTEKLRRLTKSGLYGSQAARFRQGVIQERRRFREVAKREAETLLQARGVTAQLESGAITAAQFARYRSQIQMQRVRDMSAASGVNMRLANTIGARMGLAARTLFAIKIAATAITAFAPNSLRATALFAPFRAISGVEPYMREEDRYQDSQRYQGSMSVIAGKYQPKDMREAFGVMLDFIGESLTFGRFKPGSAMGIFKDQPNMFISIAAGVGATVGAGDQIRNYVQAQGASVDTSFAVYSIFRNELASDLAFRLQSVLSTKKGASITAILNYHRGAFARRDPAKTSRFLVGSQTDAAGGSRGLMLALRIRNHQMVNLANQRPSEITMDFMRMMIGAGYASDENVDLKRIEGLPINYLGSLIFDVGVKGRSKQLPGFVSAVVGGSFTPDIGEYVAQTAMQNNKQLAERVPILSDFGDLFAIFGAGVRSGQATQQLLSAITFASIAIPTAAMMAMTGIELAAGAVAIARGGSLNLARKELDETVDRMLARYRYSRTIGEKRARHAFSAYTSGFIEAQQDVRAVMNPEDRARELYFIMNRGHSMQAARVDLSRIVDLDIKNKHLVNFSRALNEDYKNLVNKVAEFVSPNNIRIEHHLKNFGDVRRASEEILKDYMSEVIGHLDLKNNYNVTLAQIFSPSSFDELANDLIDRKSFVDELTYLFDPHDSLIRGGDLKDVIDRSDFVRKYIAAQSEAVLESLEGKLPKLSPKQIEEAIGQDQALDKLRRRINASRLEVGSTPTLRRSADEIVNSSAAKIIRERGMTGLVKESSAAAGRGFLKMVEISEVYSLIESLAMLGSENLVERRMASYAVPTFALETALGLAAVAALQFSLANPLMGAAIAVGGIALFTLSKSGHGSRGLQFIRKHIEEPLINRISSMLYHTASSPVLQPILATVSKPFRAILHDVISPMFTSMRMKAQENQVMSYITAFLVPETLDTFVDRPRFQSSGYTFAGPIQELYTPSEHRIAVRNRLAAKRQRAMSLSTAPEEDIASGFLQGQAMGWNERMNQERLFANSTLSAFSSGSSYQLSSSLSLAISRRQAILDMTVYGRYTQRPDETFPALGGEIALMTAMFKANRVSGGSPFALNKVVEEMRALFKTPLFAQLGKVMSSVQTHTGSLKNAAFDLLDFRLTTPKGYLGEVLYQGMKDSAGRIAKKVYLNLVEDSPKMAAFLTGIYNRGMHQVFKSIKERGIIGALGGKKLPMNVIKVGIGSSVGFSVGSALGGFLGTAFSVLPGLDSDSAKHFGELAGGLIGAGIGGSLAIKPLATVETLWDTTKYLASSPRRAARFFNSLRLANSAAEGAAPDRPAGRFDLMMDGIGRGYDSAKRTTEELFGWFKSDARVIKLTETLREVSRRVADTKARVSAGAAGIAQRSKDTMKASLEYMRNSKAARYASVLSTGAMTLVDIANLTYTASRVLSLRGVSPRREYDAAYKGFAEAAVTVSAASLAASVMRGRFAALKIISLAAIAKETLGKSVGEFLSEKAYEDLKASNKGKRFYERERYRSSADIMAAGLGALAVTSTLIEFSTTEAGKAIGRRGAAAASRFALGRAGLSALDSAGMAASRTSGWFTGKTTQITTSLYSRAEGLVTSRFLPSQRFRSGAPASSVGQATSRAASAGDDILINLASRSLTGAGGRSAARSIAGRIAGSAFQLLGYGAMFVMPAVSVIGQYSALDRLSKGMSPSHRHDEEFKDIFAGPMREGAGLLGAAAGGLLGGPIGAVVGGIGGAIAGDLIGNYMAGRNYARAKEAGLTSKSDMKEVAGSVRIGAIAGGVIGAVVGVAAVAGAVAAGVLALPVLALAAVGALVVGGVALIGSALGAQVGFDTSVTNAERERRSGRRLGVGGTGRNIAEERQQSSRGRTYDASTRSFRSPVQSTVPTNSSSPNNRRTNHEDRRNRPRYEERTGHYLSNNRSQRVANVPTVTGGSQRGRDAITRAEARTGSSSRQNAERSNPVGNFFRPIGEFLFGAPAAAAEVPRQSDGSQMLALNYSRKKLEEDDINDARASAQRRVNSLGLEAPVSRFAARSAEADRTVRDIRKGDEPKNLFDHFKDFGAGLLDAFKNTAEWAVGGFRELFARGSDFFKKALEAAADALTGDGAGGNPILQAIDSRISSTIPDLFAAVGLEAPVSTGAGNLNLTPAEQDLLKRLMIAENSGSAFDMAVAGRSVTNRVAIARSVGPGIYNASEASVHGIIYAPMQYQPTRDGRINLTPSSQHAAWAQEALSNLNNIEWWYQQGAARGLSRAQIDEIYRNTSFKVPGWPGSEVVAYGGGQALVTGGHVIGRLSGDASIPVPDYGSVGLTSGAPTPPRPSGESRETGEINLRQLTGIMRGDFETIMSSMQQLNQQQSSVVSGDVFATGLRTGPSAYIGGSADYHIDVKFYNTVAIEQQVAYVDALSRGYAAQGRHIVFSNSAVAGMTWNVNAPMSERIATLRRAQSAHSHSQYADRESIDFYIPLISAGADTYHPSTEGAEMLMPVVAGGSATYIRGGGGGAGMIIYDANGNPIMQTWHGDTRTAPAEGTTRSFANTTPANRANRNQEEGGMTEQSIRQVYQQAMGTMDGSHYIGTRFEEIIVQRLREAGVPAARINEVKQKIRDFNQALPAEERRRAQALIEEGRDPNYLDLLPADSLFEARDAVNSGKVPEPARRARRETTERSMNQNERENVNAAARRTNTDVATAERRSQSYAMANAAEDARQQATRGNAQQVTVARRQGPHPDDLVAAAEPSARSRTQSEVQRVATVETRQDPSVPGRRTTHLILEEQLTEGHRATVAANGEPLPDPMIAAAEPMMA